MEIKFKNFHYIRFCVCVGGGGGGGGGVNNCNHPSWLSLEPFRSVDLRTHFANFTLSTRLEANVAHLHHGLSELHIEGI